MCSASISPTHKGSTCSMLCAKFKVLRRVRARRHKGKSRSLLPCCFTSMLKLLVHANLVLLHMYVRAGVVCGWASLILLVVSSAVRLVVVVCYWASLILLVVVVCYLLLDAATFSHMPLPLVTLRNCPLLSFLRAREARRQASIHTLVAPTMHRERPPLQTITVFVCRRRGASKRARAR